MRLLLLISVLHSIRLIKREEGAYVMLAGDDNKLASEQYAVGFKKGNEELRDTVQDTLDEMVKGWNLCRDCRKDGDLQTVFASENNT